MSRLKAHLDAYSAVAGMVLLAAAIVLLLASLNPIR